MEQQNKKKNIKVIGASSLLLLSIGACAIFTTSQQSNQNTQVAVEETTTTSVVVQVENKPTKETPHTVLKEEVVDKLVEIGSQSVAEETVNTIIAVAEAKLTQPEELDKVVTLIEKPTTELDKVVGLVEQDGKKQDNKKEDDVAILPTPNKPTEEEKPTIPSDENTKPATPTEEPTNPVTPAQPTEPATPVLPTPPAGPTNPVTPTQPSEELSEDEKRLDIKEKQVDGKTVKYATAEPAVEEALPELDISKLTVDENATTTSYVPSTDNISTTEKE